MTAKGITIFHPGKLHRLFVCTSRSLSKAAHVMKENANDKNFSIPLSLWYHWPSLTYQCCPPLLSIKGNSPSDSKPYLSRGRRPRQYLKAYSWQVFFSQVHTSFPAQMLNMGQGQTFPGVSPRQWHELSRCLTITTLWSLLQREWHLWCSLFQSQPSTVHVSGALHGMIYPWGGNYCRHKSHMLKILCSLLLYKSLYRTNIYHTSEVRITYAATYFRS